MGATNASSAGVRSHAAQWRRERVTQQVPAPVEDRNGDGDRDIDSESEIESDSEFNSDFDSDSDWPM